MHNSVLACLQQLHHLIAVDGGFVALHLQDEPVLGDRSEFGECVAKVDEVVGLDVVGVFLVHFVGQDPALSLVAQAEQVLGQLDSGGQVGRVGLDRPALEGGALR